MKDVIEKLARYYEATSVRCTVADGTGKEVAATLREARDKAAKYDALTAPPPKRLREYKGIVYDPDCESWREGPSHFRHAAAVICHRAHFTDADHAALMALKAQPYEDAPDRVKIRLEKFWRQWDRVSEDDTAQLEAILTETAADLRALVRAEIGR